MAQPPKPPGEDHKAPAFQSLRWDMPQAEGFLTCEGTRCRERGNWIGHPYLTRGRPLREAARAWYVARVARMKREKIRFFEGVAIVNPTPLAAVAETPKPKTKKPRAKPAARKKRKSARKK